MLFNPGINAITIQILVTREAQCAFLDFRKAMTPAKLNIGKYPATDDHFALESGKKLGRAGMSGGRKKLSKISGYR